MSAERPESEDERPRRNEEDRAFAEEADTLWQITLGPLIWAVHFAASYAAAAVTCAKLTGEMDHSLDWLRLGIGVGTAVALALIAWVGWRAWRAWDFLDDWDYVHGGDASEDRHEFLGHAAFLLAGLSFIGVCYTALPALLIESCR